MACGLFYLVHPLGPHLPFKAHHRPLPPVHIYIDVRLVFKFLITFFSSTDIPPSLHLTSTTLLASNLPIQYTFLLSLLHISTCIVSQHRKMPAAMTPESVDGLAASSPPSISNNDSNGQQSPPAGDSDATAETDQKTKKRIQNRVAQRTYRKC